MKRSQREGWITKAKEEQSQPLTLSQAKPLSANVRNGSEILQSYNGTTRVSLAKATDKASTYLAEQEPEVILDKSEDLRRVVSSAAQIHNWEVQEQGSGILPSLKVYSGQTIISVNADTTSK